MKTRLLLAVSTVAFLGIPGIVNAEDNGEDKPKDKVYRAKKYYNHTLYTKARFNESDSNGDGFLDRTELSSATKKFEKKYGSEFRFDRADVNGDGMLTLEECKKQKQWEKQHQKEIWNKYKDRNNPTSDSEKNYVKNTIAEHPKAARVLKNDARNNPEKAGKVVKSMAKHSRRTKYVIAKAEAHNKAAKQAYKKAKKHQKAAKAAGKRPRRSRRAVKQRK